MSLHLAWFASRHFRNLIGTRQELHPRFNLFYGDNGQGKTNLLEAIYYLFTLRPMRPVRPRQLISWDRQEATVKGEIKGRTDRTLGVTFNRKERRLTLNDAPPLRLDDYFNGVQVVAFTPEDIQLVRGAPDLRRKWLDRAVFNSDLTYLTEVRQYLRILGHRNALLKEQNADDTFLEVLADQFTAAGARLIRRRAAQVQRMQPHLDTAYNRIFPEKEISVGIQYSANVNLPDIDPVADPYAFEDGVIEQFHAQIQRSKRREKERKSSLVGPHLDDIMFTFRGHPFKISASQGQTRALVLSLKVAEILDIEAQTQHHPILILDDVAGELDPRHSAHLFDFLSETNGQVLLSTTDLQTIHLTDMNLYPQIYVREGATRAD